MFANGAAILLGRNQTQNSDLEMFALRVGFRKITSALSPDDDAVLRPIPFYLYHEGLDGDLLGALVRAQRADGISRIWPATLPKDVTASLHPHIGELGFDAVLPLSGRRRYDPPLRRSTPPNSACLAEVPGRFAPRSRSMVKGA